MRNKISKKVFGLLISNYVITTLPRIYVVTVCVCVCVLTEVLYKIVGEKRFIRNGIHPLNKKKEIQTNKILGYFYLEFKVYSCL